ncbi:MAG TPA: hypothetical protein DF774_08360 [Rheinheimera sp.]|uniref:flagella basal body P-ring formation protein FlgA n=1 Tax=Rheinheimera sp. TaxID=1869214 RepID=UPI000EEABDF4|nr:flagella basal body P-ring formation protein FlgA [Rheinheimera sp.]HCU65757.1 hypothetical protein [Rheinheimera sp.]
MKVWPGIVMLCMSGNFHATAAVCTQEIGHVLRKIAQESLQQKLSAHQALQVVALQGECPGWLNAKSLPQLSIESLSLKQIFAKQRVMYRHPKGDFGVVVQLELQETKARSLCNLDEGQAITAACLAKEHVGLKRLNPGEDAPLIEAGMVTRLAVKAGQWLVRDDFLQQDEVYAGQAGTLVMKRGALSLEVAVRFVRRAKVGQQTDVVLDGKHELVRVRVGAGQKVYIDE